MPAKLPRTLVIAPSELENNFWFFKTLRVIATVFCAWTMSTSSHGWACTSNGIRLKTVTLV